MSFSPTKYIVSSISLIGLLLVLTIPAAAQGRAIKGKITDDKDQPVADANISIVGMEVYRIHTCKTNKKGEYLYLLGIESGTYRVIARKPGFQPAFKENVRTEMGEQAEVNLKLEPGQDYKLQFEMSAEEREQSKKNIEAQQQSQQKRKQFSTEVKARFDKGVTLYDAGQFAEALAEFNAALEKDPKQPAILARAGDCYAKLDKNDEALAAYDKALELTPNDTSLYTNKGVILSKTGKTAEAQELFKKAAELDPLAAAKNFYNLGLIMINAGDTEKATDALKRAIAADSNFAEAYYQLGMCLSAKPDTITAAVEALNKYIQIGKKPDQVEIAKQIISALKPK